MNLSGIFILLIVLLLIARLLNANLRVSQAKFIKNYAFNKGIQVKLRQRFPDLNDEQWMQVFQGLRDYFHICHSARGKRVAMPSRIVDEAWHEFILCSRDYEYFCRRAFGRFLHHNPAQSSTSELELKTAMKRVWYYACKNAGINPQKPNSLPWLFALDAQLGITDGFIYSLENMATIYSKGKSPNACSAGCGGGGACGGSAGCSGGCSGGGCGGGCGGG